ncbi:MAG: hypothetical protein K0U23_03525, partial [Gammaproteobacteria bacterium]|nr:hypothetical protein [Gammaproteobacteria bacterium]
MTLYASFSKNTIRFGKVAMFLFAVSASAATNFFTVISVDGAIRACSNDTEAVLEETKCGQKNMSLAWLSLFVYIVTALYSVFKNFDVAESMFSELDAAALDAFETSLRTDNPLPDKRGQRQKNE